MATPALDQTHMTKKMPLLGALLLLLWANLSLALRSGAPSMACINLRPLHGLHQAKPASASQFFVRQSALSYSPGQNVTVEIVTHSSERHFRGFLMQAYNPNNGQPMGRFAANEQAKLVGCSAATHRDNQPKRRVSIVWMPPEGDESRSGQPDRVPASVAALGSWLGMPESGRRRRRSAATATATTSAPGGELTPVRRVRFRASIVVSYSEFYTGFESSELSFAPFDYASASAAPVSSAARGMVSVAVAVSPRANTTAVAVANTRRDQDEDRRGGRRDELGREGGRSSESSPMVKLE